MNAPINKFRYNLEALRGFTAFVVVLTHCSGFSQVLNGVDARHGVLSYHFPGHLSVLIFFILSGYVIGLTNKGIDWQNLRSYASKRINRIYPIYALCLLVALAITTKVYSATEILSNAVFLQRVTAEPMYEIGVNWSLNYEVLFYILFVPLSFLKVKPTIALAISLLVGLFFQFIIVVPLVSMYGYGFCFWVIGLWLSKTEWLVTDVISRWTLIGLLCLMMSFSSLNFFYEIVRYKFHLDTIPGTGRLLSDTDLKFSDLTYLPFGIIIIARFIGAKIKFDKLFLLYIIVSPIFFILLRLKANRTQAISHDEQLIAYVFYALGLAFLAIGALRKIEINSLLPEFLIKLGGISYGVYLCHFIFIVLIGRIAYFSGSNVSLLVRVLAVLMLTLLFSWFLEKIWQPMIMRLIKGRSITSAEVVKHKF